MDLKSKYEAKLAKVKAGELDQRSMDAWLEMVAVRWGFVPEAEQPKPKTTRKKKVVAEVDEGFTEDSTD